MPTIRLSLSSSSISQAIKELKAYQKKVEDAGELLTRLLVEQGVDLAKQNADYMSIYDTGELVDGIVPEFRDGKGYVFSSAPHSAFCEFGTGIRGAESPHPEPGLANWKYDTNSHGTWETTANGTGQPVCHPGLICTTPRSRSKIR